MVDVHGELEVVHGHAEAAAAAVGTMLEGQVLLHV